MQTNTVHRKPSLLVGTATFTRHDAHTRHVLDGYRCRLDAATDMQLLAAAFRAETLPGHGIADEIRNLVDHEVEWRRASRPEFADWWTSASTRQVTR